MILYTCKTNDFFAIRNYTDFVLHLLTFDFQFGKLKKQLFLPCIFKKYSSFFVGWNTFYFKHFALAKPLMLNSHPLHYFIRIITFEACPGLVGLPGFN